MKTIPPPCPEPESGLKYWRSLDQLADTPAFRQWAEREFPAGASEFTDPVSRRHFVKIMSASFLLAGFGLTGCRRPEEKILPFARMPENYAHGVPQFYATAMPARGSAIPLVVKSHEGRPTKIEGNPEHPDSNGATDAHAQASLLDLYDPDRAQRFAKGGNDVASEAALDFLAAVSRQFAATAGEGLCFFMEQSGSPSRERLQTLLSQKWPKARWFVYEPVDLTAARAAASAIAGRPIRPYAKLESASVILSLDCDFLGTEEDSCRLIRGFASGRRLAKPAGTMSRLYAVEGLMTLTGANADHRLRAPTSAVMSIAAAVATQVAPGNSDLKSFAQKFPLPAGVKPEWVAGCAKDLLANKGASLVLAGYRQPPAVHVIAHLLNAELGNNGKTILYREAPPPPATLSDLKQALDANQVDTLVILGGNPVYNAPADFDWEKTQRKAKTVIRLGYYEDETFTRSDWHLPLAHYLESWGDARTSDGTLVPVQPLIAPLFGGLTELEVLARLGGLEAAKPYEIVRETFRAIAGAGDFEEKWKKFLHDGFLAGSAANPVEVQFNPERAAAVLAAAAALPAPTTDNLEVVFHRDSRVDDGRYINNGWLQELPDPITKMTWENVILMSVQTAKSLGLDVRNRENNRLTVPRVKVQLAGRAIEGPVWIQPGQAENTLALALGYGRKQTGRVGRKSGYDAGPLRVSSAPYFAVGAKLVPTGETQLLSCTQDHWAMEGRPIIREANLEQYRQHPDFASRMELEPPPGTMSPDQQFTLYPNPFDQLKEKAIHQWGMSIDLNACVGCSACMMACQSENNIPIVGKEQVRNNREMHWIRIDRYYAGEVADPQVVNQPMLCQHCEKAPCESVCPVNATVHDEEGLNVMVYNRCVGTRYCSNNCPYKVRRFNYFDYNKRPLDQLYKSPLFNRMEGEWGLTKWLKDVDKGSKAEDEWELMKLIRNPDVTVRMRGVMEKCTYCVQRLEQAKIAKKVKARDSGDIRLTEKEGTIPKTACQQACPAEAIVFGDVSDPDSGVSKLKAQDRNYKVLNFLATKPRTTYLARVRNPNPGMPDALEMPQSTKEYSAKNGDPFESQEAGHEAQPDPAPGAGKGAK